MPLTWHLREFRARLVRSIAAVTVGGLVALVFYDQLMAALYWPYRQAVGGLGPDSEALATISGVSGPLMTYFKVCGFVGLVGSSPVWLYQMWAFVVPGLHAHERRATRWFAVVGTPLFLAGAAVGYFTLPTGLRVLIGFVPEGMVSLVDFGAYFMFLTRTVLVFGLAFEIPVALVLLSLAGVVSRRTITAHWQWWVLAVFLFAAVATPSTDPFSMLFLAAPLLVLVGASVGLIAVLERRRVGDS